MVEPDLEAARSYVCQRLKEELSPLLVYHGPEHTFEEVYPAVEELAKEEGIEGEALLLLRTAALFHDLGFVEQRQEHELISARIAAESLPGFGYSPEQIERVQAIIAVTQLPQNPRSREEEVMADADLDVLGRDTFLERGLALRAEHAAFGVTFTDLDWYRDQLRFLNSHTYFTASARRLRDPGKRRNRQALQRLLGEEVEPDPAGTTE